jgi:hypothetical protein
LLALLDLVDEPDEELSLVPERHAARRSPSPCGSMNCSSRSSKRAVSI